tara:strand:- start:219 stop:869 length:651 start_codon:yes stop_codon:yes gene_type:complete
MFMTVEQLLKKRKQVNIFDKENIPSETLVHSLLKKAFELSPSKQNFYPFQVFCIGPNDHYSREVFFDILKNTPGGTGNINAWSAPYILFFCSRLTKEHPDPKIKERIKKGLAYEQMDPKLFLEYETQIGIEIGMYSKVLTSLCMEQNIDVAYQLCFPPIKSKRPGMLERWHKLSFIKNLHEVEKLMFCMQLGYDTKKQENDREIKPNVDEIVKVVN